MSFKVCCVDFDPAKTSLLLSEGLPSSELRLLFSYLPSSSFIDIVSGGPTHPDKLITAHLILCYTVRQWHLQTSPNVL